MDIMPERDYCVRVIRMEPGVAGVTAVDEDGFASIYINSRMSWARQLRAFNHELLHLLYGDFDREVC